MENENLEKVGPSPDTEDMNLDQFNEEFAEAEVEKFESVPDGKYQVNVEKVELTKAKSSGKPMLKWCLRIQGPESQNRILWRNNLIYSKENIKWLKTDLNTCGLELEKLSDLPANLHKLLDVKLEVIKRTRGDNESVYLNRLITTEDKGENYDAAARDALAPF